MRDTQIINHTNILLRYVIIKYIIIIIIICQCPITARCLTIARDTTR